MTAVTSAGPSPLQDRRDELLPAGLRRVAPALAATAAFLVAVLAVPVARMTGAPSWERALMEAYLLPAGPLRDGLLQLEHPGDAPVVAAATLALGAWLWGRGQRYAALWAVAAVGITDVLTNLVLKPLIGRSSGEEWAYPSGHVARTVAFLWVVTVLVHGPLRDLPRPARGALVGVAVLNALIMTLIRPLTGTHFPLDIPGGLLVGTAVPLGLALVPHRP